MVTRARRIEKFLSQPFFVAEQFTGIPGVYVPLRDTLDGFEAICRGDCDTVPEQAFFMVGTLDDALDAANEVVDLATGPLKPKPVTTGAETPPSLVSATAGAGTDAVARDRHSARARLLEEESPRSSSGAAKSSSSRGAKSPSSPVTRRCSCRTPAVTSDGRTARTWSTATTSIRGLVEVLDGRVSSSSPTR